MSSFFCVTPPEGGGDDGGDDYETEEFGAGVDDEELDQLGACKNSGGTWNSMTNQCEGG